MPVLVLHGEDDQIVPYATTALKAAELLKNGKLITYPGLCHGIPTTDANTVNLDILNFIKS
jgi:non-heme chloroperoxidase